MDFVVEIWDNANTDFRMSWYSQPHEEMQILTNMFNNALKLDD